MFLALVSPAYLASEYSRRELDLVLSRKPAPGIVPILLEPADWGSSGLNIYQALPMNAKPVSTWPKPEDALEDIVVSLRKLFGDLVMPGLRDRARKAVVRISSTDGTWGNSGVLVSSSGHVLTIWYHLSDRPLTVLVDGTSTYPATLVEVDQELGLAMLKIEGSGFEPLALGRSLEGVDTVMVVQTEPGAGFTERLGHIADREGPFLTLDLRRFDVPLIFGNPVLDEGAQVVGIFRPFEAPKCVSSEAARQFVDRILRPMEAGRTGSGNSYDHQRLRALLIEHEGSVSHMYTMPPGQPGPVMVGVGHWLRSAEEAQRLNFVVRESGSPATAEQIALEYHAVQAGSETRLDLPSAAVDALLKADIARAEDSVRPIFAGYDKYPELAQDATLDMAFTVGPAELEKLYPKLVGAAGNGDWLTCAAESNRSGVSEARNTAVRELFVEAAGGT